MKIEDFTQEIHRDRAFIIAAVSCELQPIMEKCYSVLLDDAGYQWFYDLVIEIVDEIMFTPGSAYLECISKGSGNDYWAKEKENCFDWYHMSKAADNLHERFSKDEWARLSRKLTKLIGPDACNDVLLSITSDKTTIEENLTKLKKVIKSLKKQENDKNCKRRRKQI